MIKRLLFAWAMGVLATTQSWGQNMVMNPIRFTQTSVRTYNVSCPNKEQVIFKLNGQPFNYQYGLYQFDFLDISWEFGTIKPGDVLSVSNPCGNGPAQRVVQDDFVYVEVPNGAGYTGNGIGPNDSFSPYSFLATPVNVGKCTPIPFNSHVLSAAGFNLLETNGNRTGTIKLNGAPIQRSRFTYSHNFVASVNFTVHPDGSISSEGGVVGRGEDFFSGATPVSLEYKHNGINNLQFGVWIGGMNFSDIRNDRYTVSHNTYTGGSSKTITGNFSNSTFKITYDEAYYRAYVDGVQVDSLKRYVVYSATGGTIANNGPLDYRTGTTYTPTTSGPQLITAIVDGVRQVSQKILVADDVIINEAVVNAACAGGNSGQITANTTGGHPPLSYSLNGGAYQSSKTFSNLAGGNYVVRVRDGSGCVVSKNVNLGQGSAVMASISNQTNVSCSGGNNGSVTLAASGGNTPFSYSKDGSNFQINSTFGSLTAGNYTFVVKDVNGCSVSVGTTITTQSTLTASLGSVGGVGCNGGNNGSITIATGGTPSGSIQYSKDGSNFQASNIFSALTAGNYTLTVKDNLCTITTSASVNQPSAVTASLALGNHVSCFGGNNGSVVTTASGGTGALQYSLNNVNFGTNATFGGLTANSYKVWVKDANGCIKETNVVGVNQPTDLQFSVGSKTDLRCFGANTGSVTLTASGGTTAYGYKIGTGALQSSSTFGGLAAGNYTFTLQDANGCQKTVSTTLTQPTDLVVSGMVTQTVSCNGGNNGALQASATGGVGTYTYSLNDANYGTATTFSSLTANNYTVWVQDANGCKKTSSTVAVTQPTAVTLTPTVTNVKCNGGNDGSITLTAGGGVGSYTYAQGMGSFQGSNVFGSLTANTYNYTVRDANNCPKTISATVAQPTLLVVSLAITQNVSCFGGSNAILQTTASGATPSYQYSLDDATYQTNATFANYPINTYRVWVRDANACKMQTNAVTVTQPTDIALSVVTNTAVKCHNGNDGSVVLQATGGVGNYQFANGNGSFQVSATFANLTTNTYTFRVKDGNNCPKSLSVVVTQPTQPFTIALGSSQNLNCFQNASGRLTVAGNGGTGPYQFSLDNNTFQSSPAFANLAALTYTVYGRDANQCAFSLSNLTLTQPTDIAITLLRKKDVDCEYYQRGEALLRASGSNGNFTYTLSGTDFRNNPIAANTNNTGLFVNLLAGNYTLQARDQVGCPKDFPLTIIPKSSGIRYDVAKTMPSSCTATDGQIQIQNIQGGRAPYQFNLSGQANFTTNPTFPNLLNGVYVITVADSLCAYKQTVDLTLPNSLKGSYQLSPVSCAVPTANLQVTNVTGGNGGYSWALNGGGFTSNPNYTNLAPNVYQLVLRDNPLSCQTALGFEIKEQNRADLQLVAKTDISCFNGSDGLIRVQGTNNLSPFQYAINYGTYTPSNTFQNLPIGSYLLLAKNSFGCIDSIRVGLTQPTLLTLTHTKKDNDCFDDNTGRLEGAGGGGTTPYQYSIDGSTYQNAGAFEALKANGYTLRVRDAKGCITTNQVPVNQPTIVTVTPIYQDTVRCFGEQNGVVRVIAGGGTPGYQYSRDGQNYFNSEQFANLAAGNYTFYVRDSKQCVKQNGFVATQPTVARISLVSKRDPLCYLDQNGIIEVAGSGGNGFYNFEINNANRQISGRFTGLTQAEYDFKLIDRRGCTDQLNQVKLVWPKALTWTSSTVMPRCFGESNGSVSVQIDGGTMPYQATLLNNTQNLTGTAYTFQNLPSTTYAVKVVDKNGCTNQQNVLLPQPTQLAVNIIPKNNDCFDDTTGRIEAVGKEATPPYQYSLDGQVFKDLGLFTGLKANTYTLSVRDKNGCLIAPQVPIIQPTIVTVMPIYQDTVRCFGEANGAIRVVAGGGTPNYQYSKDGQNYFPDSMFRALTAGNYTFYVRDSKRCVKQNTLQATEPPVLVLRLMSQANPLCVGEQNGIVQTAAAGGNGGYVFTKDNAFAQPQGRFEGLTQGEYAFKLTDRKQCQATIPTVTLTWPKPLASEVLTTQPRCVGEANGSLQLNVKGGVAPYQVQMGQQTYSQQEQYIFGQLAAGNYSLRVQDKNGCMLLQTARLNVPEAINPVMLGGDSLVTCKGQLVTLNANNPNRSARWMLNNVEISQQQSITVSQPGVYSVEVRNSSGCVLSASTTLKNSPKALQADFLMPSQALVGDTVVALDITKPIPERILWKLPSEAFQLRRTSSTIFFSIVKEGTYTIEMKAIREDCENVVKHNIKVFNRNDISKTDSTLGFQQVNNIESVVVFPNPNDGRFRVTVKLLKEANLDIKLTRATTGQIVFAKKDNNQKNYVFDVDVIVPSDAYMLTVTSNLSSFIRRIIITN